MMSVREHVTSTITNLGPDGEGQNFLSQVTRYGQEGDPILMVLRHNTPGKQ
jgi:hypothetical protein